MFDNPNVSTRQTRDLSLDAAFAQAQELSDSIWSSGARLSLPNGPELLIDRGLNFPSADDLLAFVGDPAPETRKNTWSDAQGKHTVLERDTLGRIARERIDHHSGAQTNVLYEMGDEVARRIKKGTTTETTFDHLGEVVRVTEGVTGRKIETYDPVDERWSPVTDAARISEYMEACRELGF